MAGCSHRSICLITGRRWLSDCRSTVVLVVRFICFRLVGRTRSRPCRPQFYRRETRRRTDWRLAVKKWIGITLGTVGAVAGLPAFINRRNQFERVDPQSLIIRLPDDLPGRVMDVDGVINFRDM